MSKGARREAGAEPVLHQFRGSHFNEKARWALDWKAIRHARVTHLPGPHMFSVRRLSGATRTPVLVLDGEVIAGSAQILARLDERYPTTPLHPEDPDQRRQALELQTWLDEEVGPAVRTAAFSVLLKEPDLLCGIFAGHLGPVGRRLYRASLPAARKLMARANGAERPEQIEQAFSVTNRALDRVARAIGPKRQLVGEDFSVADLTAASLLSPLFDPDHPDMSWPEPVPERVEAFRARFAQHDAIHWAREQYRDHRPVFVPRSTA